MYIRTVCRKNKDGSTVTYVQLAHNYRHACSTRTTVISPIRLGTVTVGLWCPFVYYAVLKSGDGYASKAELSSTTDDELMPVRPSWPQAEALFRAQTIA